VVRKQYRSGDLTYYLVFLGGSIVGLVLGNIVAKRVSQKRFQVLLTYLILLGGGSFISTGLNPEYLKLVVLLISVCVGVVFGRLSLIGKREHFNKERISECYSDMDKQAKVASEKNKYVFTPIDGDEEQVNIRENERVKYVTIV